MTIWLSTIFFLYAFIKDLLDSKNIKYQEKSKTFSPTNCHNPRGGEYLPNRTKTTTWFENCSLAASSRVQINI